MANWGTLLLVKGIKPPYLSALITTPSFYLISNALFVIPTLEDSPFMSKVSLMEVGIPKSGWRKSLIFYYESWKVQFLLPVCFLIWSHYSARATASAKLTSVMRFNLSPIVAVRWAYIAVNCLEVTLWLLSWSTICYKGRRVMWSMN